MNIIGHIVSHVIQAQRLEEPIDMLDPEPRTSLEGRLTDAALKADAERWQAGGHHEPFRPSVRQKETAVIHARAIIADILFEDG